MSIAMNATLRTIDELAQHGLLRCQELSELSKVAARYAVAITPGVAALIDPSEPQRPDCASVCCRVHLNWRHGPRRELIPSATRHTSPSRVSCIAIRIASVQARSRLCGVLPICFRREMGRPRQGRRDVGRRIRKSLDYIRAHPEIWEVILTGGDRTVCCRRDGCEKFESDLAAIDHVKIIRIHSRIPVADPSRVTDDVVSALKVAGATTWFAFACQFIRAN